MDRFNYLFTRYISKNATDSERLEFQDLLNTALYDELLKSLIDDYLLNQNIETKNLELGTGEEILKAVFASDKENKIIHKPAILKLWPKIAVAAAMVTVIGSGLFYLTRYKVDCSEQTIAYASRLLPGKNSATLILADGRKIILSDAANGKLAEEAGVIITKSADGQVIYEIKDSQIGNRNSVNTLSTAKGETYEVRLPDGTSVWLNSVSTLQYPTSFASLKERKVKLTGEGYFEVAKDKLYPFIVSTENQDVEVLGTHFNINAYSGDDKSKTTLLEGSVKVIPETGAPMIIKPGQQASLGKSGLEISEVEVDDVIAWKNGFFTFDNESMESIMTKIARWYNIKVEYEDVAAKNVVLYGSFSRFENFATVVKTLERTKLVKMEVIGNTVKISKRK